MSPAASGLWRGGGTPARGCCRSLGAGSATEVKLIQGWPVCFGEMPAPLGPNPISVCVSWSILSASVRRRGKSALARCLQPSSSMILPSESQNDNSATATVALPSVLVTGRSSPSVQCCWCLHWYIFTQIQLLQLLPAGRGQIPAAHAPDAVAVYVLE
jgi:hypothetical protein